MDNVNCSFLFLHISNVDIKSFSTGIYKTGNLPVTVTKT